MDFRTELHISQNISANFPQISHKTPILSIGSCFADMIGAKLAFYKFKVVSNPFGIIFNPISIIKLLKLSLENTSKSSSNDDLGDFFDDKLNRNFIQNQENIWYHYDFHSDLYGNTKQEIEEKINTKILQTKDFFRENSIGNIAKTSQKTLILTFGTAFVYVENQSQEVVANCHKIPQKNFSKKMLSVDEIVADFANFYPKLAEKNIQVIITVSPVRHIKDTLSLNSVSKAILRVVAHILSEKYENVHYFPAFELMNDDLRDYRFYKTDMLHPTTQAEDYIWQKFVKATTNAHTQAIMQVWEDLYKNISHKTQSENNQKHNKFLQETLFELENLAQTLAEEIDLKEEIENLKKRIK